jgi:hypothetical protein
VTEQISHYTFFCYNVHLHFFDVSGLRQHRKAWVPFFDNALSIIFVASLACYDQFMMEDPTTNRMVDSINEFRNIASNRLLYQKQIILFLNKNDLFKKKIQKSPINKHFGDFEGTKGSSATLGINYFRKKFLDEVPHDRRTATTCHITCCTDTSAMKVIIEDVVQFIVKLNLKAANLY